MDSLVLEDSINSDFKPSDFVSKQWLYVNDNNQGNYQSQIVINTQSLANSGGYINYAEAYITMPLVITLSAFDGADLPINTPVDYFVGLKNGFWHILDSMIVELNNGNVVQQVPFLNVFTSFKNLTSWSENDLKNNGSVCGFYPDTADSWVFNNDTPNNNNATRKFCGTGISNNRNAQLQTSVSASVFTGTAVNAPLPDPYTPAGTIATTTTTGTQSATKANPEGSFNAGLRKRQEWLSYDPVRVADTVNQGAILDLQGAQRIFKSTIDNSTAGAKIIRLVAKLRLKDICDFFKQMPLMKGGAMTIKMLTNQATSEINVDADGVLTLVNQNLQNNTNPFLLASTGPFNGGSVLAKDKNYVVNVSIAQNSAPQPAGALGWGATSTLRTCRLYAPCYTFSPIAEQRYLSLVPTKKIIYRDIFQFIYPNVQGGQTFNFLVSNAISNLRSVLVVPLLTQTANGPTPALAGELKVSSLQSPFSSSGGTPDPIALNNFQIQISGKNLYMQNVLYDYELFLQQLNSSNQLNGDLTTGLTSGLIGEYDFSAGYRYYYGNAERCLPSEEGVGRSVQVMGTCEAPVGVFVNLLVFCEQEKAITVDVRTGARIE